MMGIKSQSEAPGVEASRLCALIEGGQIEEAVQLVEPLTSDYVAAMIFLSAIRVESRNYLDFALAVAESRAQAGALEQIGFIDLASSLLVTALSTLDDYQQAYELHLRSIQLRRDWLLDDLESISFYKNNPDHELSASAEHALQDLADYLRRWKAPDK